MNSRAADHGISVCNCWGCFRHAARRFTDDFNAALGRAHNMEWVRTGLNDLVRAVNEKGIRSIAVPPLGCGNGGLDWSQVRYEIEAAAAHLPDVEIAVYAPTQDYQNAPKREGVEEL